MSIENIKTLIASKKEIFFDESEGGLLNKIVKKRTEFVIPWADILSTALIPTIFSFMLGFFLFSLLGFNLFNIGLSSFLMLFFFPVLLCPVLSFLTCISDQKRNKNFILKNLPENNDFKKEFFDSCILPYFMKQEIDSEMADALKLNLSLDQYKALKLQSSSNISYGDVYKFIANIDNTNQTLKEIEAEKYSVKYDNIKKEIQLV